jgi:hypothetical protein
MLTPAEFAQIAANIATTVGVVGVFIAYRQFREGARGQRQAMAISAWQQYLELALEHPELSLPSSRKVEFAFDSEEYNRYRWFVASMLFAAEQVLDAHPDDSAWRTTIKTQLMHHQVYVCRDGFGGSYYPSELISLISEVRAEIKSMAPVQSGESTSIARAKISLE